MAAPMTPAPIQPTDCGRVLNLGPPGGRPYPCTPRSNTCGACLGSRPTQGFRWMQRWRVDPRRRTQGGYNRSTVGGVTGPWTPTNMTLPFDILHRTPEEAARRIVLGFLDQGRETAGRLLDPEDDEALHDFRVAVRRTRSALRAWRRELKGSTRRKDERGLKRLRMAWEGFADEPWLLVPRMHDLVVLTADGQERARLAVDSRANYFVQPRPGPTVAESDIQLFLDLPRVIAVLRLA